MAYKYYSNTTSGWTISTDPESPKDKRWRAVHPDFGEKFFYKHDDVLHFTVRHMAKRFADLMGRPYRGQR